MSVEDLAALLKELRLKAGLSQQMLAHRALISVQAVSALERGYRKVPYPKTLERIADALSLSQETRDVLERSARQARGARLQDHETQPPHNLPRQLTSFVGRDDVVKDVADLAQSAPVVSIVGTGGAGKTRSAIEVASRLLGEFPDGVWFVELAPINDAELVAHALAATLGLQESPRTPLLNTLIAYLGQKRLLIVLDNCEHVIDQTRRVVGSLLRDCAKVGFLTTSREALNVSGERVYRIPPLTVPENEDVSPEEALEYGAVALFVDRVRAANARFTIDTENVGAIVEICRHLDGLPLALELAAARTNVLSVQQIAERLDRIFDVLSPSGMPTIARHETMRGVIGWSYGLLSTQARLLFDRLSIFAGSFSLEVATSVCADGEIVPDDVLELLSLLIAQSLVISDFTKGDARYHMLEATRQYAFEKLAERGERETIAYRHAESCVRVAERLDRDWYDADERLWFRVATTELDNFRAALNWSLTEKRDAAIGCALAGALARVWYLLAPVEGRNWVRLALATSAEGTPQASSLHLAEAELCGALGEYASALSSAKRALSAGDLDELKTVRARQTAGAALGALGRTEESHAFLREALDGARRLDKRRLQAVILADLGTLRSRSGDAEAARSFYDEALTYYVALNMERPAASIAGNLAEIEFAAGDVEEALHRADEALAGHRAWNNRRSVANDLCNMSAYLIAIDCFDDARIHAIDALAVARLVKSTVLTAYGLQHLAAVGALNKHADAAQARSNRERAAMLLRFVDVRLTALEVLREHTEQREYDRVVAALREELGERLDAVMALGADWSEDEAVAVAASM
jgi:predicted ATPase/transcriptional regulator with XRE-family HTH domain